MVRLGKLTLCEASQEWGTTVQLMAAPSMPDDWEMAWHERIRAAILPADGAIQVTLEHLRHPQDRMLQRLAGHAYCQYPFGGVSIGCKWPDVWAKVLDINRYMLLSMRMNGRPIALCSFADAVAVMEYQYKMNSLSYDARQDYYWGAMKNTDPEVQTFYFTANPHWGRIPKVYEGKAWRPLEWLTPHGLDFYGNETGTQWNTELMDKLMQDWWNSLETPDWAAEFSEQDFEAVRIGETARKLQEKGLF